MYKINPYGPGVIMPKNINESQPLSDHNNNPQNNKNSNTKKENKSEDIVSKPMSTISKTLPYVIYEISRIGLFNANDNMDSLYRHILATDTYKKCDQCIKESIAPHPYALKSITV